MLVLCDVYLRYATRPTFNIYCDQAMGLNWASSNTVLSTSIAAECSSSDTRISVSDTQPFVNKKLPSWVMDLGCSFRAFSIGWPFRCLQASWTQTDENATLNRKMVFLLRGRDWTEHGIMPLQIVWYGLFLNSAIGFTVFYCILAVVRIVRIRWRRARSECPVCGYFVSALARCPECGVVVDAKNPVQPSTVGAKNLIQPSARPSGTDDEGLPPSDSR